MASYTPNLNLYKPDDSDNYEDFREGFNDNMDKLDQGGGSQNIAENYDETATYVVGDYVIYDGLLYKCDTAVTTAETFDPTKWTHVVVTDEMGSGGGSGDTVAWTQIQQTGTKIAEIDINGTSQDVYAPKPPSKTSELNNDSGFITNTVNNLANYYLKTETYTQAEVDALIAAIVTIDIQVVASLPISDISTTTIYLVPASDPELQNIYDEYINTDGTSGGWELIGTTAIDLSNYVTTTDLATALASYVTSASLTTILGNYVLSSSLAAVATSGQYSDLSGKPTIPTKTSDLVNDSGFTSVSVNQVQTSGTKIAEITVSGTQTDLYSPGFDPQQQINEILEEIGVLGYWEDTDS